VFDYIEFFYNPQRKHVRNGMLSPIAFEQQQKLKLHGIWQTRGYSGRDTSFALSPNPAHVSFEQAVFLGQVGPKFFQCSGLGAQLFHIASIGLPGGVTGQPFLAGLKKFL
jgi:hypothetical protein